MKSFSIRLGTARMLFWGVVTSTYGGKMSDRNRCHFPTFMAGRWQYMSRVQLKDCHSRP